MNFPIRHVACVLVGSPTRNDSLVCSSPFGYAVMFTTSEKIIRISVGCADVRVIQFAGENFLEKRCD